MRECVFRALLSAPTVNYAPIAQSVLSAPPDSQATLVLHAQWATTAKALYAALAPRSASTATPAKPPQSALRAQLGTLATIVRPVWWDTIC